MQYQEEKDVLVLQQNNFEFGTTGSDPAPVHVDMSILHMKLVHFIYVTVLKCLSLYSTMDKFKIYI